VIITPTPNLDGRQIRGYLGVVTGDAI